MQMIAATNVNEQLRYIVFTLDEEFLKQDSSEFLTTSLQSEKMSPIRTKSFKLL